MYHTADFNEKKMKMFFTLVFFIFFIIPINGQRNKVLLEEMKSILIKIHDNLNKLNGLKLLERMEILDSNLVVFQAKMKHFLDSFESLNLQNSMLKDKISKIDDELDKCTNNKKDLIIYEQLDSLKRWQDDQDKKVHKMMNAITHIYEELQEQEKKHFSTNSPARSQDNPDMCELSFKKVLSERCNILEYGLEKNFNFTKLERIIIDKIETTALQIIAKFDELNNHGQTESSLYKNSPKIDESCEICQKLENKFDFFIKEIEVKFNKIDKFHQQTESTLTVDSSLKTDTLQIDQHNSISRSRSNTCPFFDGQINERQREQNTVEILPSDCNELNTQLDGAYLIFRKNEKPFRAYCDIEFDGGWTVIMRRGTFNNQPLLSFNHTWNIYKVGFGDAEGEYWLGNEFIHLLTAKEDRQLQVDLEFWNGTCLSLQYNYFRVDSEKNNYRLHIGKPLNGKLGESLLFHDNSDFSTPDVRKYLSYSCASSYGGGWWYNSGKCFNSLFTGSSLSQQALLIWNNTDQLKLVQMKIKPH